MEWIKRVYTVSRVKPTDKYPKVEEWRTNYLKEADLRDLISQITLARDQQQREVEDGLRKLFLHKLESNIELVSTFFTKQEAYFSQKFSILAHRLSMWQSQQGTGKVTGSKKKARSQLKKAFREFYRGLILLHNFRMYNTIVYVKMAKKFDNKTGAAEHNNLVEKLYSTDLYKNTTIKFMIHQTENIYVQVFEPEKSLKNSKLRMIRDEQRPTFWEGFKLGFFAGFCVPLTMLLIVAFIVETAMENPLNTDMLNAVFPVYRGIFNLILLVWWWGITVFIWTRYRINYVFIFGFDKESTLKYHQIFKAASLLSGLWILFFLLYIVSIMQNGVKFLAIPPRYYPLALVLTLVFLVMFPLRIFHRRTRFWLLLKLVNLVTSPFSPAGFAECYVGDYMTSMVKPLYDLEYIMCYYTTGNWQLDDGTYCMKTNYEVALPLLTALPLLFRFMQCIKRFYQSKQSVHLFNAGKYATGAFASTWGAFHADFTNYSSDWSFERAIWLMSFVSAVIYMYCWDIVMDWSLISWDPVNKRLVFRQILDLGRWYYYWAMLSNLVGRFVWTLTITPVPVYFGIKSHYVVFLLAVIEIMRRSQWGILRVDNEHRVNVVQNRAISEFIIPELEDFQPVTASDADGPSKHLFININQISPASVSPSSPRDIEALLREDMDDDSGESAALLTRFGSPIVGSNQ